jgi:hypothetical protein
MLLHSRILPGKAALATINAQRLFGFRLARQWPGVFVIQEECLGAYLDNTQSDKHIQAKLNKYLEFYNYKRIQSLVQDT